MNRPNLLNVKIIGFLLLVFLKIHITFAFHFRKLNTDVRDSKYCRKANQGK